MKLSKVLIMAVLLVCTILISGVAMASPSASILYAETDLGSGSYQYDFIFNNTSTAGESLYKVFFYFDHTATTTGSPLPSGWFGTVWEGTNTSSFVNTMTFNSANYIAPGNSRDGFSLSIDYRLGDSDFVAEFKNNSGTKFSYASTTAVAPEPISSILFLIGGSTFAARSWYRRKKMNK